MLQLIKSEELFMEKKVNIPQKGAGRKWSKKLEDLGEQQPPEGLMKKINKDEKKKVASPTKNSSDLDL